MIAAQYRALKTDNACDASKWCRFQGERRFNRAETMSRQSSPFMPQQHNKRQRIIVIV